MREYTKLLLVDDEPALRELLKTYLNMAGYNNVDIANDGEIALDMINSSDYDAILMDTNMPGRNGFEICSQIRRFNNSIGIFGMSGNDYAREWINSGANHFIPKLNIINKSEREKLYQSIDKVVNSN